MLDQSLSVSVRSSLPWCIGPRGRPPGRQVAASLPVGARSRSSSTMIRTRLSATKAGGKLLLNTLADNQHLHVLGLRAAARAPVASVQSPCDGRRRVAPADRRGRTSTSAWRSPGRLPPLACQVKVKENMKIELERRSRSRRSRSGECTVRSNNNVATFIKELVLELPKGASRSDFKRGWIHPDRVPAPHEVANYKDFDIEERVPG